MPVGVSASNGHGIHTGTLWCTLLDDKADGIGDTMSTHRLPCLLGRFVVRTHLRHYAEG